MPDESTFDEGSIERSIKEYIATGAVEGATLAAQRLSRAIGVGLDEVLTAVQTATVNAEASIVGRGSVTAAAVVVYGVRLVMPIVDADGATETLAVVRPEDVEEIETRTSRDGLKKLTNKQLTLVAVILIAAIYPVLPAHLQVAVLDEGLLIAAVAAVMALFGR